MVERQKMTEMRRAIGASIGSMEGGGGPWDAASTLGIGR